jgi:RNA polymerase sigma-70 factor, ECF subfamily
VRTFDLSYGRAARGEGTRRGASVAYGGEGNFSPRGLWYQGMAVLRMKREERSATLPTRNDKARQPRADGQVSIVAKKSIATRNLEVERLYDRYKNHVFRVALRYAGGNASWAEDVTHDVFIDLFDVIGRLVERDDLGAWLYRATTNRCLNKLKRERFLSSPWLQFFFRRRAATPADPEVVAIARSDLRAAFGAVNELPPKEKVAFFMRYVDGKDLREIGRVLGHTKGYVSKLLERARRRLDQAGWQVDDDS